MKATAASTASFVALADVERGPETMSSSFPSPKSRRSPRELRRMKATHLRHSAPEEVDSTAICSRMLRTRPHRLGRGDC